MTSGTANFWDPSVWSFVLTLTLLFIGMMAANTLSNLFKPLKKLLIPSPVLGGFLLLFADFIFKQFAGHSMFSLNTLEALTYHGLGLGFAAMTLRTFQPKATRRADGFDSGITVVCSYLIQAVLGLGISLILYKVMDSFWASGLLLPMGFGQGPGQAYNWGHTYEMTYGFENGTSFGLTVAAMGFVAASVGGVIYLNLLRKKGILKTAITGESREENLSAETITGKNEIPLSESMDKFTVQVALVFISYALAFLIMKGIDCIITTGLLGNFGYNTVRPLIWGFNFLFASLSTVLVKFVLRFLRKKGLVKREYTNNFMQSRIAGTMFDIMVIASIAAINLKAFVNMGFLMPLTLICVVGAVATYFYLNFICKTVYPDCRHEVFLAFFGTMTGTASTGIILLREYDPLFESRASKMLVLHQPFAILFGFPMLLLLGLAPVSFEKGLLTLVLLILLFVVMNVLQFRRQIFRRKQK